MKCIGIIAKHTDPRAESIVSDLCKWLKGQGREVVYDRETAALIGRSDGILRSKLPERCDFVVVIGGDGTLLSAARVVGGSGKPILGVNLGGLGFMTAIILEELYPVLERILRDEVEYDERMMLVAHVHRLGERVADYSVLNDVVINKGAMAKIIDIRVTVDEQYLSTYKADGLIISSPTGSTGYSLSAQGPIVYPTLHTILITPICPHMLTFRPLLVPDTMVVRAEMLSKGTDVFLTLDGQVGFGLREGDVIEVKKSNAKLRFIRSPFRDYFTVLRTKLKWGER
ncbi:MAG: putative inorganic polyphosphate/ATP-NAD kinase ((P)/ATP kinase)(ppnK) [Deltaproteobacteria bacterium]|nr:putative inorganic polyphosphate/ATP-NAD kinase ((P)/ATP kinase)(ppnK) [Deltaproteobacteria bacterium]